MVRSTVSGILPDVFSYISHFVCLYNFNYTGRPLRGPGIIGISGYDPTDIWNLDEISFLFRALPDKSLSEKAKKCKGGKKSKEHLTAALLVSATGERRKPIVIGKYANPRCLKNVNRNDLPCEYLNQAKAWMMSDLLHKILSQLNSFFKSKNRSILLFLDSAGCHPYDLNPLTSNAPVKDSTALKNCNFLNHANIALTISCDHSLESLSS